MAVVYTFDVGFPMVFFSLRHRASGVTFEYVFACVVLLLVLMAATVAISPSVVDPDLWGHVCYGNDALRDGLSATTTYSYRAQHQKWINHENLMELLLAVGDRSLGGRGLLIAKMLLGAAVLGMVLAACRTQRARLLTSCITLMLAASGLAHYWSLRPQLFSFVAYAALLSLLAWCFRGWEGRWQLQLPTQLSRWLPATCGEMNSNIQYQHGRLRWLWLAPLLMVAWTNAHGGFLAGGAIFTLYLAIRGIEAISQRCWQASGLLKRFALMIAATAAATFLNPYGYRYHAWLFADLHVPRPEITEWLPPNFADAHSLPLVLLIVSFGVALIGSRRSFDLTHVLVLVATLWQSLEHQRHIPFFALSVAFFLPRHFDDVLARLKPSAESLGDLPRMSRLGRIAAVGALIVAAGVVGTQLQARLNVLQVQRSLYPVSAVQFIADHQMRGRIVCTFNWAQYILGVFGVPPEAALSEGLRVHVDGRCRTAFSQAMLDEHFDFLFGQQSPSARYRDPASPFDPLQALQQGNPNLVLLDRGQPHSEQIMQSQEHDWVLLYQDALAQVWGRRNRYDEPDSPDYLPPESRSISEQPQHGYVAWPAMPIKS